MQVSRMMGLFLGASLVSGCAMGRNQQNVARLQSQVGLLEERVSQLERGGMAGGSAPSGFAEMPPLTEPQPISKSAEPKAKKKKHMVEAKPSGAKPSAHASTLQPTTHNIQQALKNAGFYQGPVDGKMGNQTRAAIKEFQHVNGLKDDGVAGKQTWAKLQSYSDMASTSSEASTADEFKK